MGASPPLDVNQQTDSKHGLFRILRHLQSLLSVWMSNYTTPLATSDSVKVFAYVSYGGFAPSGCQLTDRFKTWSISHFKAPTSASKCLNVKLYHPTSYERFHAWIYEFLSLPKIKFGYSRTIHKKTYIGCEYPNFCTITSYIRRCVCV